MLTEPGDGVVINPPVYPPYFADIAHARRRVVEVPLLADGALDVAGIDAAFAAGARALLLCNPHNPTGRVVTRPSWRRSRRSPRRTTRGCWSDEIHGPLAFAGAGFVPYLTVPGARGFALTAASKAFNLAGLKLGLIVGEEVDAAAVGAALARGLPRRRGRRGRVRRGRRVARRDARGARLQPRAAGVAAAAGNRGGARRRRASSPGSTAARRGSATTRRPRSSSAAAWRCHVAWTSAPRAPASPG